MKEIRVDLKKELLKKIDDLMVIIDDEFLDLDYKDFKDLRIELENVQDELINVL